MAVYYREARDFITAFHRGGHPPDWLVARAERLSELAKGLKGTPRTRLRNNERAVRAYAKTCGSKTLEVVGTTRLDLGYGRVRVSVVPDLYVRENGSERLLKLDFAVPVPDPDIVKIVTQAIFEASASAGMKIVAKHCAYLHVETGKEYGGARMGARLAKDIEAACQNLAAIWDSL